MLCAVWRRLNSRVCDRVRNAEQFQHMQRSDMEWNMLESHTNTTYLSRLRQQRDANKNMHCYMRRRHLRLMGYMHGADLPCGKQTRKQ